MKYKDDEELIKMIELVMFEKVYRDIELDSLLYLRLLLRKSKEG